MKKRNAIWTIASLAVLFVLYFAYSFAIGAWFTLLPYLEQEKELEQKQEEAEHEGLVWGGRIEYEWPHEVKVMGPPISVLSTTGDLKLLGKQIIAVSSMRVSLADDTAGPVTLELGGGQTITFCNVREPTKIMLGLPEKHLLEDPSFYTFSPEHSHVIAPMETHRIGGREASYAVMFAVTSSGLKPVSAVYTGRHPNQHSMIWTDDNQAIVLAYGKKEKNIQEMDHAGFLTPDTKEWTVLWKSPTFGYAPPRDPEKGFWLSPDRKTIAAYDYQSLEDGHPVLKAVSPDSLREVEIHADSVKDLKGYRPLEVAPRVNPSRNSYYVWRSADNVVAFAKVDKEEPGYAAEVVVEVPWTSAQLTVLALPWSSEDEVISYRHVGRERY